MNFCGEKWTLKRVLVSIWPSCKIGKLRKINSFCFTHATLMTAKCTGNVCAIVSIRQYTKLKKKKKKHSLSESFVVVVKQPESEDKG